MKYYEAIACSGIAIGMASILSTLRPRLLRRLLTTGELPAGFVDWIEPPHYRCLELSTYFRVMHNLTVPPLPFFITAGLSLVAFSWVGRGRPAYARAGTSLVLNALYVALWAVSMVMPVYSFS